MSFSSPFIRFADSVLFAAGSVGPVRRQIYDHEFVYVQEGRGFVVLDGTRYPAEPDDLFLVQPHVWHTFGAEEAQAARVIGVHFDWEKRPDSEGFGHFYPAEPPVVHELFREPREVPGWVLKRNPVLKLQGRPRVRHFLEDVCAEYGRSDAEARPLAGALLGAAILQIQRECRLLAELGNNRILGADAVRRVQRARDILERASENSPSVAEAAKAVGWTPDHLRRMCKSVLGVSPLAVQSAARLRRARELLRHGGMPVSEVARRCGFADSSHFSRVFKAETGYTPLQWLGLAKQGLGD